MTPPINVVMPTYERPARFEVAVASAFQHIPNIERFVVVLQSDYDPARISTRLTVLRAAPMLAGLARKIAFDYLAEQTGPDSILFVMDDDMEILPNFADGLPFIFDLLRRSSTGLVQCMMEHKPHGSSQEINVGMLGGGVFCRLETISAMGGWGSDVLDDTHTFIKSLMAGFRNYRTSQIINRHFVGSKGGLRALTGSKDMWEKRFKTRSASKLNELYPGLFRRWEPTKRIYEVNRAALPAKRR